MQTPLPANAQSIPPFPRDYPYVFSKRICHFEGGTTEKSSAIYNYAVDFSPAKHNAEDFSPDSYRDEMTFFCVEKLVGTR
jgi:hypothetical protein